MMALGTLICRLNPYTEMPKYGLSGPRTGEMDPFLRPPSSPPDSSGCRLDEIQVDVERNYTEEWTFGGQAQRINTAVRIPYRYPVLDDKGKPVYWVTEYLLIGYVGASGA
jgi:hypothetical protein